MPRRKPCTAVPRENKDTDEDGFLQRRDSRFNPQYGANFCRQEQEAKGAAATAGDDELCAALGQLRVGTGAEGGPGQEAEGVPPVTKLLWPPWAAQHTRAAGRHC